MEATIMTRDNALGCFVRRIPLISSPFGELYSCTETQFETQEEVEILLMSGIGSALVGNRVIFWGVPEFQILKTMTASKWGDESCHTYASFLETSFFGKGPLSMNIQYATVTGVLASNSIGIHVFTGCGELATEKGFYKWDLGRDSGTPGILAVKNGMPKHNVKGIEFTEIKAEFKQEPYQLYSEGDYNLPCIEPFPEQLYETSPSPCAPKKTTNVITTSVKSSKSVKRDCDGTTKSVCTDSTMTTTTTTTLYALPPTSKDIHNKILRIILQDKVTPWSIITLGDNEKNEKRGTIFVRIVNDACQYKVTGSGKYYDQFVKRTFLWKVMDTTYILPNNPIEDQEEGVTFVYGISTGVAGEYKGSPIVHHRTPTLSVLAHSGYFRCMGRGKFSYGRVVFDVNLESGFEKVFKKHSWGSLPEGITTNANKAILERHHKHWAGIEDKPKSKVVIKEEEPECESQFMEDISPVIQLPAIVNSAPKNFVPTPRKKCVGCKDKLADVAVFCTISVKTGRAHMIYCSDCANQKREYSCPVCQPKHKKARIIAPVVIDD